MGEREFYTLELFFRAGRRDPTRSKGAVHACIDAVELVTLKPCYPSVHDIGTRDLGTVVTPTRRFTISRESWPTGETPSAMSRRSL